MRISSKRSSRVLASPTTLGRPRGSFIFRIIFRKGGTTTPMRKIVQMIILARPLEEIYNRLRILISESMNTCRSLKFLSL